MLEKNAAPHVGELMQCSSVCVHQCVFSALLLPPGNLILDLFLSPFFYCANIYQLFRLTHFANAGDAMLQYG